MSDLPPGITARALLRALHADGFRLTRTRGSHLMLRHADGRRVVVAYHRLSDTSPIRTLKAMLADIGGTAEDLRRLDLVR
jgi:predicted RNA binding protein YcfA (HicA-like mRNA interferase family)